LANASSDELIRQARAHEGAHETDLALRRYTEALAIDPTAGDAYLGLGALRMQIGQAREAEQVFSTALEHVPTLVAALAERAHARRKLGARELADRDLADYAHLTESVTSWRELADWYGEEGRFTAELSVWRRLLGFAEAHADATLEKKAHAEMRALALLTKPIDPAAFPAGDDVTRRALANIARRGG
ncbi:MAG: tetratricopeptide repeat protein, partial [Polyangiaceae bacterium]